MSKRKHLGRSRALRPWAESLEGRQLLSATVSGTDTAGDQWTLTLKGHGTLQVLKQDDSSGNPAALDSNTEINSITVAGTDPMDSVLTGTVKPAPGSSGRVFFNTLNEIVNKSDKTGTGLGLQAINMPDFYLGYTGSSTPPTTEPIASITIPDGINSLRFGGVDTTAFFGTDPTMSPSQDGQNDQYLIKLGFPQTMGTSIVVNKIVSNSQAGTTSSTGTANPATQKSVVFEVSGRINLFEANEIDGNTQNAPDPESFNGGTVVASFPDPVSAITGEIGFVRVGGNATNFSVVTNNYMANMYVGGETNNVSVLAPNGSRNFYFGKGFDTSTIYTHSIENLYANRGSLNSTIHSERMIGNMMFGGDVDNGTFLSGYTLGLANAASTVESNIASASSSTLATPPTFPTPMAQASGAITAFIAGSVNNSVFAASDLPISQVNDGMTQQFGDPQDAFLPLGKVLARVEGTINNSTATPESPNTAFYAQTVNFSHGPVTPPRVVEPPLPPPATPVSLPGIPHVFPATATTTAAKASKAATKKK
jgi:hypothetical protein